MDLNMAGTPHGAESKRLDRDVPESPDSTSGDSTSGDATSGDSTSDGQRSIDRALMQQLCARDQSAFETAYRFHGDACFGLARRVLNERSLAEEVVQEVFVRLWNEPERYDAERGSLRSFLLANVHGRSIDVLRSERSRRARESRDAHKVVVGEFDDLERRVVDLTQAEAVRDALATLSDQERQAIELAYFGGHSYRDVATLLDQPEGTVKSRIRTGLLRLRASLIDAGYGTP